MNVWMSSLDKIKNKTLMIFNKTSNILASFTRNAPFPWNDFVACLVKTDYYKNNADSLIPFARHRLVHIAYLDAFKSGPGMREDNERILIGLINRPLQQKSLQELSVLINDGESRKPGYGSWLLNSLLKNYLSKPVSTNEELVFSFSLADLLKDEAKEQGMIWIVQSNINSPYLLQTYIRYEKKSPYIFERIRQKLAGDESYRLFCEKKEMYQFMNSESVSEKMVDDCFNRYYLKGKDNGLFAKLLQRYLSGFSGIERARQCLSKYRMIIGAGCSSSDYLQICQMIERELFKTDCRTLSKLHPEELEDLRQLKAFLDSKGCRTSNEYNVLVLLQNLTERSDKGERLCVNGELFNNLPIPP